MARMPNETSGYPATLKWNEGEREALLAAPFADESLYFYVPKEKVADYRARAAKIPAEEWLALLAQEGFQGVIGHAYGPKDLVFADLRKNLEKYPDQYVGVGLALARFGDEALPFVLAQAHRVDKWPDYAASRMPELGPVDAAEIALPVTRLMKARKLEAKKAAEAWIVRHPEATLAGLAPALEDAKEEANVVAAFTVLAKAGHGAALRELLGTAPSAAKNKALVKAAGSAGAKATGAKKAAAEPATHRHVGWVYYRAHASSPLVLGDLDVMKDWPGSDGGEDELVKLPKGEVVTCDLDLRAPDVFLSAAGDEVVLMAAEGSGRSLREEHEDAALLAEIAKPLKKTFSSFPLTIRSGALVVSIAYNATPAKGAKVAHLAEERFTDDTPRLPKTAPTTPTYEKELLVVPMPNGTYDVVVGRSGMMKCIIRKKKR
jgi:hypothetical protein